VISFERGVTALSGRSRIEWTITTSPRQTAIRPHTPKNVRITSTVAEQGGLFS
jgi:hypothetical protein